MTTVKVESLGLEYVKNWEIIDGIVRFKDYDSEENSKNRETCNENWCHNCEKCEHLRFYERINYVYRDQIEEMETRRDIFVRLPGKTHVWYYFMMFCETDPDTKKMKVCRDFWINEAPYHVDRQKGVIVSMKDY